MKDSLDKPRCT